ncbi:MAG: hypothetical protein IPH36_16655 [Saprospiraceae bacterium]|nr:hypothetical protein [Saprospiraceae bacterium]
MRFYSPMFNNALTHAQESNFHCFQQQQQSQVLFTFNEQQYLIEIYPTHDVLVHDWLGQEVGQLKSVRNIPGIDLHEDIHLGDRAYS